SFTNGTPIPVIVAALGTNYSCIMNFSYSAVWMGPGPAPPRLVGLQYSFADRPMVIWAIPGKTTDPLEGKFKEACASTAKSTDGRYSRSKPHATNQTHIGQQNDTANSDFAGCSGFPVRASSFIFSRATVLLCDRLGLLFEGKALPSRAPAANLPAAWR